MRNFIFDFVTKELDNYLHRNPDTAELLLRKIVETERSGKRCPVSRRSRENEPSR